MNKFDSINMILKEVSDENKTVLITDDDIQAISEMIISGFATTQLKNIVSSDKISEDIKNNMLIEYKLDDETISMMKKYVDNQGNNPDVPLSTSNKEFHGFTNFVCIKPDDISAVILMSENTIAIYRKGLAEPINIHFKDFETSKRNFDVLKNSISVN